MDWRTWSPFQSKKVREICAQMTEAEKDEIARQAAAYGRWGALTFAIPVGFIVMLWVAPKLATPPPFFPFQIPLRLAICVLAALLIIQIARAIRFRKKLKKFLASTEWVRSQGYTADEL